MMNRVLIVEDDKDIRRNVKRLLDSEGYDVDAAENGRVALDILQANVVPPQVILLDISMPIMDGFQFRVEQLKDPKISAIPVVVMTADGHIEEKTVRTGANGSLKKPADAEAILKRSALFAGSKSLDCLDSVTPPSAAF